MTDRTTPVSLWTRAVADSRFRDALIDDPLRALAEAPGVHASPEQVRQLDEMGRADRMDFVMGIVREVHMRGGQARFGAISSWRRPACPPSPSAWPRASSHCPAR